MSATSADLELSREQFAFYFSGTSKVDAKKLAKFLERAATVANRKGVSLYVTAVRSGSLVVILSAAKNEVLKSPTAIALAAVPLVQLVVSALVSAMSPENAAVSPLAKAGIELVEEHDVEKIEIVTTEKRFIVMDLEIAREISKIETKSIQRVESRTLDSMTMQSLPEIPTRLTGEGLTGRVAEIEENLFFSPDGYSFFIPVELSESAEASELIPGSRARIAGRIVSRQGRPDCIIVHAATAERSKNDGRYIDNK